MSLAGVNPKQQPGSLAPTPSVQRNSRNASGRRASRPTEKDRIEVSDLSRLVVNVSKSLDASEATRSRVVQRYKQMVNSPIRLDDKEIVRTLKNSLPV